MNSVVKKKVGKYEVGRTIGEGTFAKVKLAKNIKNGEYVAIKIIDKHLILKHNLINQVTYFTNISFSHCHFFFLFPISHCFSPISGAKGD